MICHNCEVAGYLNQEANRVATLDSVALAEAIRVMCRGWHAKCKDRGCPCQHVIGDVLVFEYAKPDIATPPAEADTPERTTDAFF